MCEKCIHRYVCEEWANQHEQGMSSSILRDYLSNGINCDNFILKTEVQA
jgi:hypothetical protein